MTARTTTTAMPAVPETSAPATSALGGRISAERLDGAIGRARGNLLTLQADDGHWRGELEADSVLESEYIMLLHFLGRTEEERVQKMARRIRSLQLPAGGWAIYHILVVTLQAFIFMLLTIVYLALASQESH